MTDTLRVVLEVGPKGKKVVAVASDWPGLERGAKTEEAAATILLSCLPRYAPVARLAGMAEEFSTISDVDVTGTYPGSGSTDFWGISFAFSEFDLEEMSKEAFERELALMHAGWAFFDEVRSRVSSELAKGPRGAAKTRDHIVRHTIWAEFDMAKRVGVPFPEEIPMTDDELKAYREDYTTRIRSFHAERKPARKWPLRYLIRHTAYHAINHAWEMEDKDLTNIHP
jgi:hypothetical protein